jgi:enediyne polyketide synthase
VSAAHAGDLTLAVAAVGAVGCDLETVTRRDAEVWRGLLGAERCQLAEALAMNEDFDTAATRVWCAIECLKKAGAMGDAPLMVNAVSKDGWTVLFSGARIIATCCAEVRDVPGWLVVGVLVTQG